MEIIHKTISLIRGSEMYQEFVKTAKAAGMGSMYEGDEFVKGRRKRKQKKTKGGAISRYVHHYFRQVEGGI